MSRSAILLRARLRIGIGSLRNSLRVTMMVKSGLALTLLTLTACTVTPLIVKPSTISFSGTNQNSGIIAATNGGWIIDSHKRDRYNALISDYGNEFRPVLKPDAGLSPLANGNWLMDDQHMVDLEDMEQWRRSKPR